MVWNWHQDGFHKFIKEKTSLCSLSKNSQILLAVHRILIEDCCFKVVLVEVVHYFVQVIISIRTYRPNLGYFKLNMKKGKVLQSSIETWIIQARPFPDGLLLNFMVSELLTSAHSSLLSLVENRWCLLSIFGRLLLDGLHVNCGDKPLGDILKEILFFHSIRSTPVE